MISVFDLFKIGLGPSSSHTVGPMKAAKAFRDALRASVEIANVRRIETTLYGSLAWTGRGHATDKAVVLGLQGFSPDNIDPDAADAVYAKALAGEPLVFDAVYVPFALARDIVFDTMNVPPAHPNTLAFRASNGDGDVVFEERWLSVGGGFVVRQGEEGGGAEAGAPDPFPFANGSEMLALGKSPA